MYIHKVALANIRGFHYLEIHNWSKQTLIVGKNGTGKTTLLRAIALALCPESDAHSLLLGTNGSLISFGKSEARIQVNLASLPPDNREMDLKQYEAETRGYQLGWSNRPLPKEWQSKYGNWVGNIVVAGYGVGRSQVGFATKPEYQISDSVSSLFNYQQLLLDPELTLRRLQDFIGTKKYKNVLQGIKHSLELTSDDEILLPKGGGILLSGPTIGKQIPLEAWADGYRLMFYWLIDLYGWAMQANSIGEDGHIRGIVLIDEIEQHLHPSLQTEILPRLAKLLPHVQLFATTHSPLVVLGASPQDVVVLRQVGSQIVKEEAIPDFTGYSAEDMLVDERLFDTPNVYSPDTNRKLAEYNQLAEIPREERSKDQTDRLRNLARELRTQEVPEFRQTTIDPQLKALLEKHNLTS